MRFPSVRVLTALAIAVSLATSMRVTARHAGVDETRALWVTRATLTSPESITRMVDAARQGGFNTLLVQVRGRGDAYYSSSVEPRAQDLATKPGFDPLQTTIERAGAAGLRVHAWLAVNLVSGAAELPAAREHVVYRNPEWLMVPKELSVSLRKIDPRSPAYVGQLSRWTRARPSEVEGLYLSPIFPAAASHIAAIVREIAERYPVDGLHLDYVRYPREDFDYSPAALGEFKAAIRGDLGAAEWQSLSARERFDPLAFPTELADRWNTFRRSRLTSLVMRVRTALKQARPTALLSAALVPDERMAFGSRLQDWRTWTDQGLLDVLCPMAYTTEASVFAQQVGAAVEYAGGRPVWAGIGAYRLPQVATLQHIEAARRIGASGVVLFSYEALIAPPNTAGTLSEIGRAAFGTSY
jgi:uncharacterized lipoprotein YddW (UPF0748 family)